MKNLMKVLSLVLVLMLVVAPTVSFAGEIENFINSQSGKTNDLTNAATDLGGSIYVVFRTVAIIIASCMIVYMAIQWILATPAKKAELKGRMISLAIGVVLLFGGAAILTFVEKFADSL